MADLSPPHQPPSSSANFGVESDDISSLLHTLLHNSSQPSTSSSLPQLPGSAAFSQSPALFDSSFPFSKGYYTSMEGIDDVECHSEEEARMKSAAFKNSSKRSRAAEVHNMSEKRRRQRINEKLKALQKLIPNSNKTDKASMLDEAIEYLKQLQLQVQMLTLRNGSSSHPFYLPVAVQPPPGPFNEANNNGVGGSFTADEETSMQAMFNLSSKPASDYKQAFVSDPSMTVNYRPFHSSMPAKVLCKDPALHQLQLDMSQCGQSSSSGVSS
ncbi:unnamed protein product [Amaranthus hypochondriacus]